MSLRSITFFLLAVFALVACGPSSAQIKTARTARYHTTASAAFQAGVAALKDNDYKIQQVDPVAGRAITDVKWYEVDGTSMSRDSEGRPQMTSAGGIMFAVEIAVMPDADTFYVQVIPHVQQMKAGYSAPFDIKEGDGAMPGWVTGTHLSFLAFTVVTAHTPALFVGGFLFFLAFTQATRPHQSAIDLRPPLLVGFFLAGLVVHGAGQQWWIAPVLSSLAALPLMLGATVLTAFNDNAAITYLASLVPGFTPEMKYAVVAGAVTGGGLTVIANAPNPAGQSMLARYFPDGLLAGGLLLAAIVPTVIMGLAFWLL